MCFAFLRNEIAFLVRPWGCVSTWVESIHDQPFNSKQLILKALLTNHEKLLHRDSAPQIADYIAPGKFYIAFCNAIPVKLFPGIHIFHLNRKEVAVLHSTSAHNRSHSSPCMLLLHIHTCWYLWITLHIHVLTLQQLQNITIN